MAVTLPDPGLLDFASDDEADELVALLRAEWLDDPDGWQSTPATMAHFLTGGEFKLWRYARLLGERFRDAAMGDDPHQIWELPSQYGKTSHLMWGVLWLLDRDPSLRIMYVSYDADRAVDEGGRARDLATDHAAMLRFRLRPDRRARGMWATDQGGSLYCTGIRGAITGFPQDVLLLDDLIKGWQAAHSAAERETVWSVYRSQIRLRAQSSTNPIILAGTRWHEDDIAARLMATSDTEGGDEWSVLRLPAIAEAANPNDPDPLLRGPDPLGREPGEVLEAERFPPEEVRARQVVLGSYLWSAMEQQRPAPEEGGEIKRAWWQLDDRMPSTADAWVTSWDLKLTDRESGSFVVGQAWARTGPDFWCVDQLRGQWNQATAANAIALMSVRFPHIMTHVVENKGNAPEVITALQTRMVGYEVDDEMAGALGMTDDERERVQALRRRGVSGIVPNPVKGDKATRARAVSGYIEAGNVHLPRHGSWVPGFLDESSAFPNGSHDDQVDAWSQALGRLAGIGGPARTARPRGRLPETPRTRRAGRVPVGRRW